LFDYILRIYFMILPIPLPARSKA